MGRLSEPDSSSSINHFSHQHTLQLNNYQSQRVPCNGCNLEASGMVYGCTNCNYFLHAKCANMPREIKHPFDKDHVLSLLHKPIYPEGVFNCDACGKRGNGFSYHCGSCSIDLHIVCASLPMLFTHKSHHHQMNLTFSPPYHSKSFSCDFCRMPGSNTWLYRCDSCGFDVHLACVTSIPGFQASVSRSVPLESTSRSANWGPLPNFVPIYYRPQAFFQNNRPQTPLPNYMQCNPPYPTHSYASATPCMTGQAPAYNAFGNQNGGIAPTQSPIPPNNAFGLSRDVGNLQMNLLGQLVNGIASGGAQSATGALIQAFTGGGSGTDVGGISFDSGFSGVDFGGFGLGDFSF